jgi:hypothetical protein
MTHPVAVVSMLHESADVHSAARLFRGEPVLAWTLRRLQDVSRLAEMTVICWEDQLSIVEPLAAGHGANVLAKGPRLLPPTLDAIAAARRWSDRTIKLLGSSEYDLGVYAPWTREAMDKTGADGAVLIDPSAALVDAEIIDALLARAAQNDRVLLCASRTPPGIGGAVIRSALLDRIAADAGVLRDAIEKSEFDDALPLSPLISECAASFRFDSQRQIARLTHAMVPLNGTLVRSHAETIITRLAEETHSDPFPRDIVLELTTDRWTRPAFIPSSTSAAGAASALVPRRCLTPELAQRLLAECAAHDDVRLSIAGVGDPLLSNGIFELIQAAREAGVWAIRLETDLLNVPDNKLELLAGAPLDIVLVHLPAATRGTYRRIMGVDGFERVCQNIAALESHQREHLRGIPLTIPLFTELDSNRVELPNWRRRFPDGVIASAMATSGVTVLADGRVVTCAADAGGCDALGRIGLKPLGQIWQSRLGMADASESMAPCARCGRRHAA